MKKAMQLLEVPIHVFTWIALISGILMMFHVSADVAFRAFDKPLIGTNEIVSGYYMILIVYLPWAYVARNDNHICADIFVRHIPPAVMIWLEIVIKVWMLAYVLVFTWQTILRAMQQMRAGEALQLGAGYLAVWPSRFALPLAGGLMAIYLVVRVLSDIVDSLSRKSGATR